MILYLLALILMFSAVSLAAYNLRPAGRYPRLRLPPTASAQRKDRNQIPSLVLKLTLPIVDPLAFLVRRTRLMNRGEKLNRLIQKAGLAGFVGIEQIWALKFCTALAVPFVASRIFAALTNPALFLAAGVAGWFVPEWLLADARRRREHQIIRRLPGAVDVLSLSVEAGLDFLSAIQRQVERGATGPLRDELATILHDIRLGATRSDALKAFAARVETPEITSFVSVLVQADMLGAPIGIALKSQAERMRVERFQRAERAGAAASQKILFPLVLFIFPAVLIVIMGPVALLLIYGE